MCPIAWDDTDEPVEPLLGVVPIHVAAPGLDPVPLDHLRLDGVEFSVSCELRLITERSIWLLRPDSYFRIPQDEGPREQIRSIEGRMDDCRWHEYRRAWFDLENATWLHVRILPAVGPPNGNGIYTGRVQVLSGTWDEIWAQSAGARAEEDASHD